MKTLVQSVLLALWITPLAAAAQVGSFPGQTNQASAQDGVTFDILSDTEGTQLSSYLGILAPELQQSFLSHLSAADAKSLAHQQVDVLLPIGASGEVSALCLATGTQDSLVANAAWTAVRDNKYGLLPITLAGSYLTLRVHFRVAQVYLQASGVQQPASLMAVGYSFWNETANTGAVTDLRLS